MIHVAVALVVLSLTCAVLVLASLLVPAAPNVDVVFVTGTCAELILSGVLLWYVRRARL
ncbi:MAG: hypothetical protein M3P30_03040 [Chloroflexota bacterium]|nr:hypothetical protein [Chloroflexota bacterium]